MPQLELLQQHGGHTRAASARAAAEPITPAPTTAISTRSTAATIAGHLSARLSESGSNDRWAFAQRRPGHLALRTAQWQPGIERRLARSADGRHLGKLLLIAGFDVVDIVCPGRSRRYAVRLPG